MGSQNHANPAGTMILLPRLAKQVMRRSDPELLGMDLRQAENQFAVWLAHTLDLLTTTTAEVDRVVSPH